MKASIGFIFFMLFLAGIAFINLRGMQGGADALVTSADRLTDAGWRPTHIGEMIVDETSAIFLQFNDDGEFVGNAGCNRFFGGYEVVEGKLEFGAIGATRTACDPAVDALEYTFLESIGNSVSAYRVENRLALRGENDLPLLRFVAIDRQEDGE